MPLLITDNPHVRLVRAETPSETLVVVFCSYYAPQVHGDDWFTFLRQFKGVPADRLFVRDVSNQWYNRGIPGVGDDIPSTATALRRFAEDNGYRHILAVGSSMGGYGALAIGAAGKFDRVLAISPQTFLAAPYPRWDAAIHRGEYADVRPLVAAAAETKFEIMVAADELFDVFSVAPLVELPQVRIHEFQGTGHNIPKVLNQTGALVRLFARFTAGELDTQPLTYLADADFLSLVDQVVPAYYGGDIEQVIAALRPLAEAATPNAGCLALLASALLRKHGRDCDEAMELFARAVTLSPQVFLHSLSLQRVSDWYESRANRPRAPLDAAETARRLEARRQPRVGDWEEVRIVDVPLIPAQISPGERRYLYWLASTGYCGVGTVVEIGSWLGASTAHLAAGLRDGGVPGRVHTHDRYKWGSESNSKYGLGLANGADFSGHFVRNLGPLAYLVEAWKGEIKDRVWPADNPIEILFLDAPKSASLLERTLRIFGPALVPGQSMLVLQDYQHPPSYEIPLALEALGERLELTHVVTSGGTVSFNVAEGADLATADIAWVAAGVGDPDRVALLWDRLLARFEGAVRNRLLCGKAFWLHDVGRIDAAVALLAEIEFDARLAGGWRSWSALESMTRRYPALFATVAQKVVQ